jgi:hypothetical protein
MTSDGRIAKSRLYISCSCAAHEPIWPIQLLVLNKLYIYTDIQEIKLTIQIPCHLTILWYEYVKCRHIMTIRACYSGWWHYMSVLKHHLITCRTQLEYVSGQRSYQCKCSRWILNGNCTSSLHTRIAWLLFHTYNTCCKWSRHFEKLMLSPTAKMTDYSLSINSCYKLWQNILHAL